MFLGEPDKDQKQRKNGKACRVSVQPDKLAVLFLLADVSLQQMHDTVKILKFGTPQTIAIIVLKIEKFDVTVH